MGMRLTVALIRAFVLQFSWVYYVLSVFGGFLKICNHVLRYENKLSSTLEIAVGTHRLPQYIRSSGTTVQVAAWLGSSQSSLSQFFDTPVKAVYIVPIME